MTFQNTIKPKLELFSKLTDKYIPNKELADDQTYSEDNIMHFQAGLLFGTIHSN